MCTYVLVVISGFLMKQSRRVQGTYKYYRYLVRVVYLFVVAKEDEGGDLGLECVTMWTKVLMGLVSVMAFLGVVLNSCAIRAILQRLRRAGLKMPIDCFMLALFVEDVIYNIGQFVHSIRY